MALADYIKRPLASRLAQAKAAELQVAEARKTPAMRQHEYAVARKSILSDLSSLPPTATQECVANEKAARRKKRLELVNKTLQSCPKHAKEAARLRGDMDEVENMRCAKHVYLANDPNAPPELRDSPPPGFRTATQAELEGMGLDRDLLSPESNFRAAVYIKDEAVWGANPTPGAVVAFRGSTEAEEDWCNNFNQDANLEAQYYRRAVSIGNRLASTNANIHIVGHSLGGGLASAAQGGSGLSASTYNAAGLHPGTVARYSQDRDHMAVEPDKITAIRVRGEVLTKVQESVIGSKGLSILANDAVGGKRDISAFHEQQYFDQLKKDNLIDPESDYSTYLHGMDEVIESTEAQKRSDEDVLKACLRGKEY